MGWIGLGNIGAGMAGRALAKGHEVVAYARGAGQQQIESGGGRLSRDYVEIAAGSEILAVCVYSDAQLREAVIESGALAAMRSGSVLAVHTTGSPALARELAECAPIGVNTLDACFSGGPNETARGELTLMVGGAADGVTRARPVLETYASRIHHVGPAGAGQTLKLLNNLLFATNLRYAAEIMRMADAHGLIPSAVAQVIQQSSGSSMAMGMFTGGRTPQQALDVVRNYMVKDVQAARDAARADGVDLTAFASVVDYYQSPE